MMLCLAAITMTAWGITNNGVPEKKGEHCTFTDGIRYSELVISSRLNDFKANTTAAGFGVFDATGHLMTTPASTKSNLDYVPGLVAKAIIEAVDYYRGTDAVDVKPWFYAIQHYGNSLDISSNGKNGKSFDDLNAVKLYFKLRELSDAKCFADGEQYTNAQTVETADARFKDALKGISKANSTYVIKASTLEGAAGGWWHKSGYVNQMWCDGQYMGPALLAQMLNEYGSFTPISDDDWALVVRQFTIAWHYLWDEDVRLLYHAFTADPANTSGWAGISAAKGAEVYHSAEFWGRAEAWYFLALVDVLEQMQQAGRTVTADYATLRGMLQQLGAGIAAKQDAASGCWYQLLNHDGSFTASDYDSSYRYTAGPVSNYLESSCTAIFTAAYLKGMRLGLFDADYTDMAKRAYKGFVEHFMVSDGNGGVHLVNCCKSAGLGGSSYRDGSAAYYLMGRDTEPTVDNPSSSSFYTEGKVLGGFILAATEYERRFMALADANGYAGGDGTRENPYLISNAEQLARLANDVNTIPNFSRGRYFKLTHDIVINSDVMAQSTTKLTAGTAFPKTPMIGSVTSETSYLAFQGTLDGDGHTIRGFYQEEAALYISIFRITDGATIRNLHIEDSFIYGNANSGAIVGRAIDTRLVNCSVSNSLVGGYGSYIGSLVGQALGSTKIQNCYATNSIMCKNNAGGIVGRIGNGDQNKVLIENCYAACNISTSKSNRAGITSENSAGSTIRNCWFLITRTVTKGVWLDNGTSENVEGKTADELASADFLAVLNANAMLIAGACQWVAGETSPTHDYSEVTPEASERLQETLATDPIPANKDMHANADGGTVNLMWTLPVDGKTVKQYLYFGTDSAKVATAELADAQAVLALDTSYSLTSHLSPLTTCYWRIDREDAEGVVTQGDVWSFQPRHLAFPGAEGYGRFARGGRGGKVVYVTNLNNQGEGSLRWALTNGSGPRTVLFRVSGVIDMGFQTCWTDPQVTIAGQTAPGKGICLKHCDMGIGSDNIVRHLRARRGLGTPEETGNAIGTVYSDHTILDHVTASWGTDETFSSRSSRNITFQRSIISEALGIAGHRNYDPGTNHGYAATIGGDIGSFHHNLLADCNGRNWSMGGGTDVNGEYAGRLDIFNNVVYNWNGRTTDGGAHETQFVGNYYKMGPDTRETFLFTGDIEGNLKGTQRAYVTGNIRDNKNGTLTQDREGDTYRMRIRDGRPKLDWDYFVNEPFWPSYAEIETAPAAYKSVLSDVGANQPMSDLTDQRIFRETLERTYTYVGSKSGIKGEIDNEADAGGFEDYPEELRPVSYDTDYDGLPDWWEEIRGTNPNTGAGDFTDTNADLEGDGYTELERYLDFMAQPHVFLIPGASETVNMASLFAGYTNQPAYAVEVVGTGVTVVRNGALLSITSNGESVIATVNMVVSDAEGSVFSRRLCVAVSSNETLSSTVRPIQQSAFNVQRYYNLMGQKIGNGYKGIVIVNGKKYNIK